MRSEGGHAGRAGDVTEPHDHVSEFRFCPTTTHCPNNGNDYLNLPRLGDVKLPENFPYPDQPATMHLPIVERQEVFSIEFVTKVITPIWCPKNRFKPLLTLMNCGARAAPGKHSGVGA